MKTQHREESVQGTSRGLCMSAHLECTHLLEKNMGCFKCSRKATGETYAGTS